VCGSLDWICDLPKNADYVLSVENGHRCDLDANAPPVPVEDHDAGLRRRRSSDDLPREQLPDPPGVLGRDNRGELATRDITDEPPSRGIDPANDPVRVDHVARHVDVLEDLFEVHRVQRFGRGFHFPADCMRRCRRSSSNAFNSADTIISRPTRTSENSSAAAIPSAP